MNKPVRNLAPCFLALLLVVALASAASAQIIVPPETFRKTVGVTPNVCGSQHQIVVQPGTTVYYCYFFKTSVQSPFSFELNDDILGPLDSGIHNGTYQYIVSQTITENVTNVGNMSRVYLITNQTSRGPFPSSLLANATVTVNGSGGSGTQFDASIPTLSEVSMFVFGGLLLLGAAITFRRTSG